MEHRILPFTPLHPGSVGAPLDYAPPYRLARAMRDEPNIDLYAAFAADAATARRNEDRTRLIGLACCALSAFVVIYFGWQSVRPFIAAVWS